MLPGRSLVHAQTVLLGLQNNGGTTWAHSVEIRGTKVRNRTLGAVSPSRKVAYVVGRFTQAKDPALLEVRRISRRLVQLTFRTATSQHFSRTIALPRPISPRYRVLAGFDISRDQIDDIAIVGFIKRRQSLSWSVINNSADSSKPQLRRFEHGQRRDSLGWFTSMTGAVRFATLTDNPKEGHIRASATSPEGRHVFSTLFPRFATGSALEVVQIPRSSNGTSSLGVFAKQRQLLFTSTEGHTPVRYRLPLRRCNGFQRVIRLQEGGALSTFELCGDGSFVTVVQNDTNGAASDTVVATGTLTAPLDLVRRGDLTRAGDLGQPIAAPPREPLPTPTATRTPEPADTTPPQAVTIISPLSGSTVYNRKLTLHGRCESGALVKLYGPLVVSPLSAECSASGEFTADVHAVAGTGVKAIDITQEDSSGNISPITTVLLEFAARPTAYIVSNSERKILLVGIESDGGTTPIAQLDNWTYGDAALFLPSNENPTHAVFFQTWGRKSLGNGKQVHLFRLQASGLPETTPLASVQAAPEVDGYRAILRGATAGKLLGVQRLFFSSSRMIDNISYDLEAGTLQIDNQIANPRSCPEQALVWKNRLFMLLDHCSHGIAVHPFHANGSLSSTQSSFYQSCSGTSLCNGGWPGGELATHPTAARLYQVSLYHAKLAVSEIDEANGSMSHLQTVSTRNRPWTISVHPTGRWLYVGHSLQSGFGAYLQVFALNEATGAITPTPVYEQDLSTTFNLVSGESINANFNANGTTVYFANGSELRYAGVDPASGVPGTPVNAALPMSAPMPPQLFHYLPE